jgi:hypothetical protein
MAAMVSDKKLSGSGGAKRDRSPGDEERPFDTWLRKQLHAMYDEVAKEPLPQDLIKLIDSDSARSKAPASSVKPNGKDKPTREK